MIKTVQIILNGQTYSAEYDTQSKKYKATITAPGKTSYNEKGHYYPLTVKALDTANNRVEKNDTDETLGNNLRLRVREKAKPTIEEIYPTQSAAITSNSPVFKWKVLDEVNGSGVNPDTIGITLDSGVKIVGAKINKEKITNGYSCTYTHDSALEDGTHVVKYDAQDYDENSATQKVVTYKIDTVPPTLNISAPVNALITNQKNCVVKGTTNDVTSSPVKVKVNEKDVTVSPEGSFETTILLEEGNNTITIVATDSAGKSTTVTRTVTLDTVAPTIKSVTLSSKDCGTNDTITILIEVVD